MEGRPQPSEGCMEASAGKEMDNAPITGKGLLHDTARLQS